MENPIPTVLDDIKALVPMGGVTIPGDHTKNVDFGGLYKRRDFFVERAKSAGLQVIEMKEDAENPCPFIIITFPEMVREGKLMAKVALVGHIDVVDGKPDLFEAEIEGDFIKGRGTTDMLAVDATFLEWMRDRQIRGGKKPPFVLMLSATEENDSKFGHNTYTAKEFLEKEYGADLEFAVIGERTGEMKKMDEPVESTIRDSNYGLRRYNADLNLKDANATDVERALKAFSRDTVSVLRKSLDNANVRDRTSTTFANPFFEFDSGFVYLAENLGDCVHYHVPEGATGKHSAQSQASEVTPLETAMSFVNSLRDRFHKLRVLRIKTGNMENFNRVSAGIDMDLALGVTGRMYIPNGGIHVGHQERALLTLGQVYSSQGVATINTGVEIREAPEHSALVGRLINQVYRALRDTGASLKVNTLRSGWTCDPNNQHLAKLRSAFQSVTGLTPEPEVKVFFNDGAAFIHGCEQHMGAPIARAAIFGQTGFAPHADLERHYIPSIETGWRELDAFADQYLPE